MDLGIEVGRQMTQLLQRATRAGRAAQAAEDRVRGSDVDPVALGHGGGLKVLDGGQCPIPLSGIDGGDHRH